MEPKSRITTLSTRYLLPFKIFVFILYSGLYGSLLFWYGSRADRFGALFQGTFYGYLFFLLFQMLFKIKYVEYDSEYLYVRQNLAEVMIPLENIKNLEIKTVGEVYRVDLYAKDLVGSYFYFKPSIAYPLNFRKKDREVEDLGKLIQQAKSKHVTMPANALTN